MSERPAQYSSPAIVARQRKLLDLTRVLIAETGFEAFSIGALSARAGVAKQTIYNIFQTRERMIAAAIQGYFEANEKRIAYETRPGTMERTIERSVVAGLRAQQVPNYMRALMATYHAPDADPEVRRAIHNVGTYAHEAWVERLATGGVLQPWIDPGALTDDVARFRYGMLYEWCCGRVAATDVVMREVVGCLTMMAGATRGAARDAIEARLARLHREGLPAYAEAEQLDLMVVDGKGA